MKTMIIGAGDACKELLNDIDGQKDEDINVVCLIDDDMNKIGSLVEGIQVVGDRNSIIENAKNYEIELIIIALPSISAKDRKPILEICQKTNCIVRSLPSLFQLVNPEVNMSLIRNVDLNDLLGREPVAINERNITEHYRDKVVMVTGGGGSIGSELCRHIASFEPKQLIIVEIYENSAYEIQQELKRKHSELDCVVLIGSVRSEKRMEYIISNYRPDIIFHAAAHKHVPLMEESPHEAIKNNVYGTYNVASLAIKYNCSKFVLISTDKAVNPTNIMGASKRLCELIIQTIDNADETDFVAVRFGNVLGSNGSVIPLFKKQIEEGGPVTVTHPDIIRFFMTIPEAVSLVLEASANACNGEIFVLDMGEPVKILDMAKNMIRLSGYTVGDDIKIEIIGLRPGEKLYEEVLLDEENLRSTDNKNVFLTSPIDINKEIFWKQLSGLFNIMNDETSDIKKAVKEIVTEYSYKE